MEAIAGVFRSRDAATRAAEQLRRAGFPADNVNLLLPGASEEQIHSIPVSETEQPGLGGALGGLVGGGLGVAGGLQLGTAVASAVIPGVGPVVAIGLAAAALFGAGGAVAGAKIGMAAEHKTTEGLPADELFFYEDALRQGRSVVVALVNSKAEAQRAQEALANAGAESLDAARDAWWIGLRDAEREHYTSLGRDFDRDHDAYRTGFQAALERSLRGMSAEETERILEARYPAIRNSEAFRTGFDRGRIYRERVEGATAGSVFYGG
jgi:hypothetical protein